MLPCCFEGHGINLSHNLYVHQTICLKISPEDPVDGALDVVVRLLQRLDALLGRHAHRLEHRQTVGVRHKAGRGGTSGGSVIEMCDSYDVYIRVLLSKKVFRTTFL